MTTVICSEPVTIDLELSGATLQVQPTAWSSTPSSGAGGGRCGGRGARVLAYQAYTFTSGDEVKFQRGPDYFSVWVNGSVMMTVPVDWEADR